MQQIVVPLSILAIIFFIIVGKEWRKGHKNVEKERKKEKRQVRGVRQRCVALHNQVKGYMHVLRNERWRQRRGKSVTQFFSGQNNSK